MTSYGKRIHQKHVEMLLAKLALYGVNPFSKDAPKALTTGVEIKSDVVRDMENAASTGNTKYELFIKERLAGTEKGFFDPIKRIKLQTGLVKVKKVPKAISILKEDFPHTRPFPGDWH